MRLVSDDTFAILTIFQEAEGEPYEGKLAVAEVIRNRTERKYASDGSVAGTVLWPIQFSGWNSKDKNRIRSAKLDATNPQLLECAKAWAEAQAGSNTVKNALLYYNPSLVDKGVIQKPDWDNPQKAVVVAIVGQHHFFTPLV